MTGVFYHSVIHCLGFFICFMTGDRFYARKTIKHAFSMFNHKNYNFLDCDWFKKLLFSTNSLVKLLSDSLLSDTLLSDSLLSDSSISQSHSKLS